MFFFLVYLLRLWLSYISKISFISYLEVPYKFVCGWWGVESEFSDRLWLSFSLALAKAEQNIADAEL